MEASSKILAHLPLQDALQNNTLFENGTSEKRMLQAELDTGE
jgi:hypothetical protein